MRGPLSLSRPARSGVGRRAARARGSARRAAGSGRALARHALVGRAPSGGRRGAGVGARRLLSDASRLRGLAPRREVNADKALELVEEHGHDHSLRRPRKLLDDALADRRKLVRQLVVSLRLLEATEEPRPLLLFLLLFVRARGDGRGSARGRSRGLVAAAVGGARVGRCALGCSAEVFGAFGGGAGGGHGGGLVRRRAPVDGGGSVRRRT